MQRLSELCITALAVCLILLMLAIGLQVICSALDINPIVQFENAFPVINDAITLNSLLDFQWHLLVVTGLIPIGLVWLKNKHVRVDFLFQKMSSKWQGIVDLTGNLLFALPFFVLMVPAGWSFMLRAWRSDEGSRNGGLVDLWLIKAVLPLGLVLLAAAIGFETYRLLRGRR